MWISMTRTILWKLLPILVCGDDVALCQITLTSCLNVNRRYWRMYWFSWLWLYAFLLWFNQANELLRDYEVGIIEHSGKMIILMDIISQSVALSEKILVFRYGIVLLQSWNYCETFYTFMKNMSTSAEKCTNATLWKLNTDISHL